MFGKGISCGTEKYSGQKKAVLYNTDGTITLTFCKNIISIRLTDYIFLYIIKMKIFDKGEKYEDRGMER